MEKTVDSYRFVDFFTRAGAVLNPSAVERSRADQTPPLARWISQSAMGPRAGPGWPTTAATNPPSRTPGRSPGPRFRSADTWRPFAASRPFPAVVNQPDFDPRLLEDSNPGHCLPPCRVLEILYRLNHVAELAQAISPAVRPQRGEHVRLFATLPHSCRV